jgi:hypothetical protein
VRTVKTERQWGSVTSGCAQGAQGIRKGFVGSLEEYNGSYTLVSSSEELNAGLLQLGQATRYL